MDKLNTTVEPKPPDDRYTIAAHDRNAHSNAVLQSTSTKRLVVAGPGTGKTFLFSQILMGKQSAITLSFVRALIEDLAVELCGLCEVRTLHGFACGEAVKIKRSAASGKAKQTVRLNIFPQLSAVIAEDSRTLRGPDVNFDAGFRNLTIGENDAEFYATRKKYYDHSGFTDIVYFVYRHFKHRPQDVPKFDQVLVDEYQDFNALEVALIELLADFNPILITGDDDQSLYQSLTGADPRHIRKRFEDDSEYETFTLPYCSRCTRVIVEAINDWNL